MGLARFYITKRAMRRDTSMMSRLLFLNSLFVVASAAVVVATNDLLSSGHSSYTLYYSELLHKEGTRPLVARSLAAGDFDELNELFAGKLFFDLYIQRWSHDNYSYDRRICITNNLLQI